MTLTDVYIYSGPIERSSDWHFIKLVAEKKKSNTCLVIMCSGGGSPDAAYKMAKYLQLKYDSYSVLVSGMCKSAATLFAIGANELVFCPFGELGPLDIQLQKEDKLFGAESGLNISEAFNTLELRAKSIFNQQIIELMSQSGGVVTFKTASEVATGLISALYGPIFSQIEPEEVGSRARAMRIGEDYAKRLNSSGNLKDNTIQALSTYYAAHSFVIDYTEASTLFNNVRLASDQELALVNEIGDCCRFPSQQKTIIDYIDRNLEENANEGINKGAKAATKRGKTHKANDESPTGENPSKSSRAC